MIPTRILGSTYRSSINIYLEMRFIVKNVSQPGYLPKSQIYHTVTHSKNIKNLVFGFLPFGFFLIFFFVKTELGFLGFQNSKKKISQ